MCIVCGVRPALRPEHRYPICVECSRSGAFAEWHRQPCARPGCDARRWMHIANETARLEGRRPALQACDEFLERDDDRGTGAPVPVAPGPRPLAAAGRAS